MIKFIQIFLIATVLSGCSYEPILLKKNYNISFNNITSDGEKNVNEIIINKLSKKENINNEKNYDIYFTTRKIRETVSSNRKGDPKIYRIKIKLTYNLIENNKIILKNEILKQATYNNKDDKLELLKYEENLIRNLSEKLAEDVLISVTAF